MTEAPVKERAARKCGCVYATAANTSSVRSGHEMGGYVKEFCAIHATKEAPVRRSLDQSQVKSRDQEGKYHAILGEITVAMRRLGRPWDNEDVKRLMLEQFAHDTGRPTGRILPSLDGQRLVQTQLHSRKFLKADASEFVEWLHAWCVENGVELTQ